jgi:hypothetical protein
MWCSLCDNPQALERLYTSNDGLDLVDLHEVVLHRDGPRLQMIFDLARFPDRPSQRWDPEANTLQVQVSAWGVKSLRLEGWTTAMKGFLRLEKLGDIYQLTFRAESTDLSATCHGLRIDRLSAYCSDASLA